MMSEQEVTSRLVLVVAIALGGSGIIYLLGILWGNFVERLFGVPPSRKYRKIWTTTCLALPIVVLGALVRRDYEDLREWWFQSSVAARAGVLLMLLLVFALLVGATIRLWRPSERLRP